MKKNKSYVYRSTIWNAVGGGFSNPSESRLVRVGKHKVFLERSKKLDSHGNPVHTATVVGKNGAGIASYRSNGNATFVVGRALEKSGVGVRYSN